VKYAIELAMYERGQRTKVTQDRVIQELAKIAFINPTDVVNSYDASLHNGATREDTAAISSIRVRRIPSKNGMGIEREIKLNDKIRALDLLGKHLGLFNDKLNITADAVVRIVDDLSDSKDDAMGTNGEIEE
jgi:phage terminase small subunit